MKSPEELARMKQLYWIMAAVVVFTTALFVFLVVHDLHADDKCDSLGGTVVRTSDGWQCLDVHPVSRR